MIGTRVKGTFWQVQYRHRNLAPPSVIVRPGAATEEHEPYVTGNLALVTADPTGEDVRAVAESIVLRGKASPGHEFTLLQAQRLTDFEGLAIVESEARPRAPGEMVSAFTMSALMASGVELANRTEREVNERIAKLETAVRLALASEDVGLLRELVPDPVCVHCYDTHRAPVSGHMCNFCPIPCERCRQGATGPFCEKTPCGCPCHQARREPPAVVP